MAEKEIGKVFIYFAKPGVAALKLTAELKVGNKIHIKGHTTDFEQAVDSIQIENKAVETAKAGDDIGVKVKDRVRPNDTVFLVEE
ncbi:MAG: translation elongation factor-like protein [archaeon]|nr:MAG: translation elongation factor-like protein [archaeon]